MCCLLGMVASAAFSGAVCAQGPGQLPEQRPESRPAPPAASGGKTLDVAKLPPHLKLGARANLIHRQIGVRPVVVIVPDTASYVAAVSRWRVAEKDPLIYPVLIDDGTFASRAVIARFVRAFKPTSVVRWKASGGDAVLPESATQRRTVISDAQARVWGVASAGEMPKRWADAGFVPPGVVVATPTDPAWTAALALSAAHGEPLLWIDPPAFGDVTGYIPLDNAESFRARLDAALMATGLKWNALGDDVDAVTLCFTSPSRVFLGEKDKRGYFALTDMVGRSSESSGRTRWAWAGQIMGGAPAAAASAMGALFLIPEKAWLLDGYDSSAPWNEFDASSAADLLKKTTLKVIVDDAPSGASLAMLRDRLCGSKETPGFGIDAGLIAVNSSGQAQWFDLKPGQALVGDVPALRVPAMVYMVHSFSAASPTERSTIAGAWFERGAYAYVGSCHEPMLRGFVPTPLVMRRLLEGLPWGVAVRYDDGPAWKIAVYGDPLITFGPQGPRVAGELPLPGLPPRAMTEELASYLKARELTRALGALALLGRDADAVRLILATAKDQPTALTPEFGLAGIESAFAAGDLDALLTCAEALRPMMDDAARLRGEGAMVVKDMVWQALGRDILGGTLGERASRVLPYFLRIETLDRDRAEAMRACGPTLGKDAEVIIGTAAAKVRAGK